MQLTYRGQAYTSAHQSAFVNSQSTFIYRGQSYQPSAFVATNSLEKLVYRGISYR